jgi:hypothetical protein
MERATVAVVEGLVLVRRLGHVRRDEGPALQGSSLIRHGLMPLQPRAVERSISTIRERFILMWRLSNIGRDVLQPLQICSLTAVVSISYLIYTLSIHKNRRYNLVWSLSIPTTSRFNTGISCAMTSIINPVNRNIL